LAPDITSTDEQELRAISEKLLRGVDPRTLPGSWERLSKPGLRGRERWRWEHRSVAFVKRYAAGRLRMQLDRVLKQSAWHSRGWWEWKQAMRLRAGYVPAPEPLASAEHMWGPIERASVVALSQAPGDAFDRVWQSLTRQGAPVTCGLARHDMARRLGQFTAAFHAAGSCHRDLYLCHIFAEIDPAGEAPPRFTVIDLARVFRPRLRRMRWILKDLSQLDYSAQQIGASRADRLRFLLAYLGLQLRSPRSRWYARRVSRRSARIRRREHRKGRA
jgi:heptose I phosphotransferase